MALTTQQIHATAYDLQEKGINPTLSEVRKALGGGSFTTISDAMKSWRQDHKEEQELKQVELPNGINERLQALGAEMWQTAIDIAHDRLTKEREALEVIKAKSQQDVDQYAESVKTLETEHSDLLKQLDEVTATAETASTDASRATAERDALTKSLNETEHKLEIERNKADSAQSQLAEVRTSLDKAQSELTASLTHVAKLEAQADNSKAELERLSAEAKTDRAELKKVTAERDKISTDTAEIKGELKAVAAQLSAEKTQNESWLISNEKLTKANATLEAERKALDKALGDLKASHKAEQEQTTILANKIKELETKLETQNKTSNS